MSLSKTYRVSCDSGALLCGWVLDATASNATLQDDLARTRDLRIRLVEACRYYGPAQFSAAAARSHARKNGWKRHREDRAIYAGSEHKTKHPYDLCPGCAPLVSDDSVRKSLQ